ncbi:MAG: hypothetical protein QMD85_05580, partial [Candidatus Aenigmarchaeota archaeon]|nr:hypothetical protein [Candidatus Aenigmarchaeota archaeon]
MIEIIQRVMDAYEQEKKQIINRAEKLLRRSSYFFFGSLCLGAGLFGVELYKSEHAQDPPPLVQTYKNAKKTLGILEEKRKTSEEELPYRTEELDRYMAATFPSYLDSAISVVRNDIALMEAADEIKAYRTDMKKSTDSVVQGAI